MILKHVKMSKAEKQEARKELRKNKCAGASNELGSITFVVLNILFILIIIASIVLSILDKKYNCICWDANSIGVFCQIITAIVSFVVSIIGIAISLQKDECWGVSIKEFNNLRVEPRYPATVFVVLAIVFSALNAIFYIFQWILASIGVAFVSLIFCVYVTVHEIPLVIKNEKCLTKIVKKRLMREWVSPKGDFPKELKKVLKNLISSDKTLKETYLLLKLKNEKFNRYLILKLLELQCDAAKELNQIESKQEQIQRANRLYENVWVLLFFDLDLSKILREDFINCNSSIIRVIFELKKINELENKTTSLVAMRLYYLKLRTFVGDEFAEQKNQFIVSIILSIVTSTIHDGDFSFVIALQERFSIDDRDLQKDNYMSLVFALISMQFYFLCHDSQNASEDLKSSIKKFLDYSTIKNHARVKSWRSLYARFAHEFNVNFENFMFYFTLSANDWDVPLYFQVQWIQLDRGYAFRWYLIHVLNSFRVQDFNYSDLCGNDEYKFYLKDFGKMCFGTGRNFIIIDKMKSILDFYGINDNPFSYFLSWSEFSMKLFNYINGLKKEDLFIVSDRAVDKKNDEIADQYKETMLKAIREEWGYDDKIITTSSSKTLTILVEKTSRAVNYEEVMGDALIRSIFHELRLNIFPKTILRSVNFDGDIEMLLNENITAITESTERIRYFINDEGIRKRFLDLCANASQFNSNILDPYSFVKENGFRFNVILDEFSVRNLTVDELNEEVEKCKSADGQYVYEGTFLSREEIERFISQQFAVLKISMRYAVQTFEGAIFVVELF